MCVLLHEILFSFGWYINLNLGISFLTCRINVANYQNNTPSKCGIRQTLQPKWMLESSLNCCILEVVGLDPKKTPSFLVCRTRFYPTPDKTAECLQKTQSLILTPGKCCHMSSRLFLACSFRSFLPSPLPQVPHGHEGILIFQQR